MTELSSKMSNAELKFKVQGALEYMDHAGWHGDSDQHDVFRFFGVTVGEGLEMLESSSRKSQEPSAAAQRALDEACGNSQKSLTAKRPHKENGQHTAANSDHQGQSDAHDKQDKQDKHDDGQPPSKKRKDSHSKNDKSTTHADDLSDIKLEGEENDTVPVYETCDMIRRKIDQHLKQPGLTQSAFCRDLEAQYHSSAGPKHVSQTQLATFRGKKGYDAGNTSTVFYAAYCFFEKLRIKEGKPKSKDRQKMEELWAERGGFDTKKPAHTKSLTMGPGESFKKDKYGQVTIHTMNGTEQSGVM